MLPILYKYDSKGKIRVWMVETSGSVVVQTYGLAEGKKTEKHYTAKPKNVGKANETTAEEQAQLEAEALWRKKIKIDDYAENVEDSGKQLRAMLAHDYLKVPHKLQLPCIAQPKLDGVRGLAYINDEDKASVEIQSRKGELYQITEEMESQLYQLLYFMESVSGCKVTLDGEYYIHGKLLQDIVGSAKKMKPLTKELEFHIFDCIFSEDGKADNCNFVDRYASIGAAIMTIGKENLPLLKVVGSYKCSDMDTVEAKLGDFTAEGYEGIMLRQDAPYELHKRSYSLLKYKKFVDDEFEIIGHEADKDDGVVWHVSVPTDTGSVLCKVRPMGELSVRQLWNKDAKSYYGKLLKVKYQSKSKDGNLSFPVGIELDRTDV